MAGIFITRSTGGLGRAAAQTLLEQGHEVVVHAGNRDGLGVVREFLDREEWPRPRVPGPHD